MQNNMISHNIIITEPCRNLRALGRNALKNRWKTSIIAVCVFVLTLNLPPVIFNAIFGTSVAGFLAESGNTFGLDIATFAQLNNNLPQYCILSAVYIFLITGAMMLGLSIFFLATFRRHDVHVADIFLGFEKFGKALGLFWLMYLFIFLWSLLFLIPGIIATFRYSQAFFILADDPSKGVRQCINESKEMMKGNKFKYFLLNLSFIGWAFLCAVPQSLIQSMGPVISNNDFIIAVFNVIGSFCMVPVTVYVYSTIAGFYEILSGHLIKETRPVPVTVEEAKQTYAEIAAEAEAAARAEEEAAKAELPDEAVKAEEDAAKAELPDETVMAGDGAAKTEFPEDAVTVDTEMPAEAEEIFADASDDTEKTDEL